MIKTFTRQQLKEVLMSPKEPGLKEPYFIIEGFQGENITILPPGKFGLEFNKTYGHFHSSPEIEIFRCFYGQGLMVMQRNDIDGAAKEFKVVPLRAGSVVEIPSGFGQSLINVGKTFLVVLDNSGLHNTFHQTEILKEKRGFCYYVIERQGEAAFAKNPNYDFHPQITA